MKDACSNRWCVDGLATIRDMIRWGASRFNESDLYFGHGTDNALDEAAYLVAHALHLSPTIADRYLPATLMEEEKRHIANLFRYRVEERVPAAYLTQEAWFCGLSFYVDERVLIPRSPIAELIEQGFSPWFSGEPVSILEIGTGSGCIAIALAYAFPNTRIDAVDISLDSLTVAQMNLERHGVEGQVRLIQGDLFPDFEWVMEPYDLIIANPPYVDREEMENLLPEYRHEPVLALAAGYDGLDNVRRILTDASRYLAREGLLVVEVGNSERALMMEYPDTPFIWPEFTRSESGGVFLMTEEGLRESAFVTQTGL